MYKEARKIGFPQAPYISWTRVAFGLYYEYLKVYTVCLNGIKGCGETYLGIASLSGIPDSTTYCG